MVEVRLEKAGERIRERRLRSNKVIELRVKPQKREQKKESFKDFSSKLSHIKEGGHLLSRIALQYHRRRRA